MEEQKFYKGQIYYVYPTNVVGSEQESGRPAIIVSNNLGNEFSDVVEVVYLTTKEKKFMPTHVKITSSNRPSTALCEQIHTVSKERIGNYINEVTSSELTCIERALLASLDISCNLRGSKVLEAWRQAYEEEKKNEKPAPETPEAPEKPEEAAKPATAEMDLTANPEYIRIVAERDIYKDMVYKLMNKEN